MTEETQTQESVQLQINDLQAILQVIDVLSSRGAVRPEEMSQVGAIRDKLARFLAQVASAAEQKEESPQEETVEQEEA